MREEQSLMEMVEEQDAADEDLLEILILRNSSHDESAVKEAADRRVQTAGSVEKAAEQATQEMERANE